MATMPTGYVRKGRAVCLQLDFDALDMLRELAPTQKSHGRYLSELIRRDYIRRQEWEQARAVVCPVDLAAIVQAHAGATQAREAP